jgi:hypothetical protein
MYQTYFENLNSIPLNGQVENGNMAVNGGASGSGAGSGPQGYGQL